MQKLFSVFLLLGCVGSNALAQAARTPSSVSVTPADPFAQKLGGLRGTVVGAVDAEYIKNGEGATIRLKDGALLHAFSRHRKGAGGDADLWPSVVAQAISTDDGKTWSRPEVLFRSTTGENAMQPSLVRLANGEIGVCYSRIDSGSKATKVFRYSADEGRTWSREILISPADGYWTSAHDRMLVLSSGRVLLPLHTKLTVRPRRVATRVAYSDDQGRTWKLAAQTLLITDIIPEYVAKYPDAYTGVFAEASIAERADKSLLMIGRTMNGHLYAATSQDQGLTWSAPRPTSLVSSAAPGRLIRVPNSDDLLVIWNSCCFNPAHSLLGERLTLSSTISTDGGKTWRWRRELVGVAPGLNHGVHYPSILIEGDKVFVAYRAVARDPQPQSVAEVQEYMTVLPLAWFYTERDHHRPEASGTKLSR